MAQQKVVHMAPLLANAEILACLQELCGQSFPETALTKPDPDMVTFILEHLVERLVGVSREDLNSVVPDALAGIEFPNLHEHSIPNMQFLRYLYVNIPMLIRTRASSPKLFLATAFFSSSLLWSENTVSSQRYSGRSTHHISSIIRFVTHKFHSCHQIYPPGRCQGSQLWIPRLDSNNHWSLETVPQPHHQLCQVSRRKIHRLFSLDRRRSTFECSQINFNFAPLQSLSIASR
jgi:hypothetical protein